MHYDNAYNSGVYSDCADCDFGRRHWGWRIGIHNYIFRCNRLRIVYSMAYKASS